MQARLPVFVAPHFEAIARLQLSGSCPAADSRLVLKLQGKIQAVVPRVFPEELEANKTLVSLDENFPTAFEKFVLVVHAAADEGVLRPALWIPLHITALEAELRAGEADFIGERFDLQLLVEESLGDEVELGAVLVVGQGTGGSA